MKNQKIEKNEKLHSERRHFVLLCGGAARWENPLLLFAIAGNTVIKGSSMGFRSVRRIRSTDPDTEADRVFSAHAFSTSVACLAFKHFLLCSGHWAIRVQKRALSECSRFPSSPLSTQTSTLPLSSLSHSHCTSMPEHLSGRLDHSPRRTGCEPNRVPMEEVVDFTGGDSDEDLSDVNQDAHAIALALLINYNLNKICRVPLLMLVGTLCSLPNYLPFFAALLVGRQPDDAPGLHSAPTVQ